MADAPKLEPETVAGSITVAEALELESLKRGSPEVVAGHGSLSRPIRWAHAGEVRNLAALLRGGELVLTTGIALDGDARAVRRFAAELAERGIAGLVLELGSVFNAVPAALVDGAAEHDLPLIALHREVAFVEVTEAVNHELLSRRLLQVRRLDLLQERFTTLMLDGAGIPEVLGALAAEMRNPVVLQRDDGDLLFHAVHEADSSEVLNAWDGFRRGLPGSVPALSVPLPSGRGSQRGSLVALALDRPFDEITRLAMERAGALVAVVTRQTRQEEVLVARDRGNLLAGFMDGDLSENEIVRQVEAVGFPRRVPHLLPCVLAGPARVPQSAQATVWTMVWREVRQELEANAVPVLGGLMPGEGRVAMVVGLPGAGHRESRADALAARCARALEKQVGSTDAGLLYVGDASRSWTGAIRSLREVVEATSSPRSDVRGWYDATRPDLHRLLWALRESPDVRSFVERRLGPLIQHDDARRSKLLPTLEKYLECGGRKTDTARALHLERQSLYHRISRIEALLGESLDDPDTRLGAHLAIRARRLLGGADETRPASE
ncbi:MAG: PucR family transcriptional regulator ligand-binding domain-containing protein [Solirubrobacteraceae bacterium]|nr:PucR family transcriptional regulator ligand-binding domain-containing protein [Solirubrobacteraceae bacterium]